MDLQLGDFIGNESLVGLLRRANLPPASLFSGPEGVGKKTLALLLATLANCQSAEGSDLCASCPSCVKARAGIHPDILLVDQAWLEELAKRKKRRPNPQVIPIDAVAEVVQEAQFRPYQGRLRFFIIDQAEKMNLSASNALLKTLEEPPPTTRIILVTAFPNQLLETVRSRCQHFSFRRLEREQIVNLLKLRMPGDQASLQAAFSNGSIGKALTLDLEATLADRDLMLDLLVGWIHSGSFHQIFSACESKPLNRDLKDRTRTLQLLEVLETIVQDIYRMMSGDPGRVVNQDRLRQLEDLASRLSLDWITSFLYHVREARAEVGGYVNSLICFETLWLKCRFSHA